MNNSIPELDKIRRQLMTLEKPKKQKILVVDDEPDNLDLLYRTFRRDFQVLKADSGMNALQVLAAEGEVAVIISDQRMPEMKGTEFLSKTVPQFPNTVRIILTGFTDIEDLVEAINAGQVYKYITKPWDPAELKAVVQRAAETYDLLKQRTEELRRANAQMALLTVLVQVAQQASSLEAILNPIATAFGESFSADGCILQLVENLSLVTTQGSYSSEGSVENWLAGDPLTSEAIATGQMQVSVNVPNDEKLAGVAHYTDSGVEAHLIIPITYAGKVLAVLSLQWKKPCTLREDELKLIHLSAQLVATVLSCTRYHQTASA
ncbi:response regulator [Fischerella thermalis]|jgi:response regulator RpfG family c-di-GMP phosphodiesterase|uniref:Response regulator receiver modulated GAF sensor protein n=1 Tax=Fischerella thermalis JSC-11 TaxID=741277 RepID=G6FZS8_9CYAN|nr:response regulator [Fischerella thermalis]PMB04004.1 two-component system response regulator [Fischerella thermalis CCMEE 5273]EHC08713.1 response regulator receiver modulated GAF sensor protein [Fischerella thermalis JSC-11]PLZ08149.1 two-component system response regulator [Fischerella thermalis WC1110]PLZ10987.1 two-component system response regulator [Fischerella thermalis WC114]PLZ22010.1 two-component system response regulator [Fischerella thermalis WC157]